MALFSLFTRRPERLASESEIGAVLRELAPDVKRWMSKHLGPRADLDDATQEALIAIAEALVHFRGESSVRTYAYRIALRSAHRFRHKHRHASRTQPLHVALDVDSLTPEVLVMQRESLRRFYAALDQLSEKRRDAFVLCAIEKLAHDEAARIAGTSVETLRARLKHARADLEAILRDDPYLGSLFTAKETP